MSFFTKNKICVTHNGTFHADDLFATAVLSILNNGNIKIIRTRDPEIIKTGDYVYDVGGIYDPEKNRFDHHQKEFNEKRSNGIIYSSFGLIWRKFGEQICESKEIADIVDISIVQPIDAKDNGIDIIKPIFHDIFPYSVEAIFLSEIPTWKENIKDIDKIFYKQVLKVVELLKREIKIIKDDIEGRKILIEAYEQSQDKKIIIIDKNFPRYLYQYTLSKFIEPIYIIFPSSHSGVWKIEAIKKSPETMESRKPFPEDWRGVLDIEKLRKISNIPDIIFCHKGGFLTETLSKESALSLAEKALLA